MRFCRDHGVEMADPEIFVTERRRQGLITSNTVGAVAVDDRGHTAVTVSTGGYTGKMPGRLGDSPLAGRGSTPRTIGAIGAAGTGEGFIRLVLSRQVRDMMSRGTSPQEAAEVALQVLGTRMEMAGGIIAFRLDRGLGHAHTTDYMPVAIRGVGG
jgi:L-asparaginase / beta-aspartyl-peptidase